MFKYELGEILRDKLTGLEGSCTGRCEWRDSKPTYFIEPVTSPGIQAAWVAQNRIEVVES